MPSSEALRTLRWLTRSASGVLQHPQTVMQGCASSSTRLMATVSEASPGISTQTDSRTPWQPPAPALITVHSFPSMTPLRFEEYSPDHLLVPLRRDLLHRAVIYEGDKTRQGTASTKWRDDVHGSGRKLAPQKGTGHARVGDKKSPIRRGGGVAHGPHPRDFSTDLPKKMYDKAWRIALSYRYTRGSLLVVDNLTMPENSSPWFWKRFFEANPWGKHHGGCTFVKDRMDEELFSAIAEFQDHCRILDRPDLDVKDILKNGKMIIEKKALDKILRDHSRDIPRPPPKATYPEGMYFS